MINNTGLALLSTVPPGSPSSLQLLPASSVGGLAGAFATVLYVDTVRGNDATAVRGNDNLPYKTIQAALNAMQTDDIVQLAPQIIAITAQLTVPATVVRGQCCGYKTPPLLSSAATPGCTIISSSVANAWELGATLGLSRWVMTDLIHSGNKIISADGSVAPYVKDTFLASGLYLTNCVGWVTAKYATLVVLQDHGVGNYVFTGCGTVQVLAMEGSGGNFTLTWDAADALTTTGNSGLQILDGSQVGAVTMAKQAHLNIDELSRVSTITGVGLNTSGANVPSVTCCGSLNNVDFATAGAELPDTATALTVDFRGSRFYYSDRVSIQPATLIKFKVAGAAANAQAVKLDSCTSLPPCTFIADAGIDLTMRGAHAPLATLSTPAGTGTLLPPSPLLLAPVAVAAAPQPVALPCRIPAGSTAFEVNYQSDNAGSVPTSVITARTQTGFSAGLVAAGGGNLTASVSFPG